jgi:hypothetical protein
MSDQFFEQQINIKFCVKLLLKMKHGAFSIILKANNNGMEIADIPKTQESSYVEITNEDNTHYILQYQVYCSQIHSTRPNSHPSLLHVCGNIEWLCESVC